MDKILYISDLDGTLLNSKVEVSKESVDLINSMIQEGICFSVATARTPATVETLLERLSIKIPVVLMNGAVIYDLEKHHYIKVEYIETELAELIAKKLGAFCYEGFIYTIEQDKLFVYYEKLRNEYQKSFFEERKNRPQKLFVEGCLKDFSKVIYFTFMDTYEKVEAIYNKLKEIKGLALSMYKDIYNEGAYFLEVYSDKATKANGIAYIKEQYDYDKIICFGDNLNDLTMFKISDECYAVDNAHDDLKKSATGIILHHDQDAVARFMSEHQTLFKRKEQ